MAILEMIPPEYWRRLKRELSRLNLDRIPETALPDEHPDGRSTALQYEEAMDAIIGERYKKRIQELEWVAEKRKEKIGELEVLLQVERDSRANIENMLGKEVRENFKREQKLMREIADATNSEPKKQRRGRLKESRSKKNEVPTR